MHNLKIRTKTSDTAHYVAYGRVLISTHRNSFSSTVIKHSSSYSKLFTPYVLCSQFQKKKIFIQKRDRDTEIQNVNKKSTHNVKYSNKSQLSEIKAQTPSKPNESIPFIVFVNQLCILYLLGSNYAVISAFCLRTALALYQLELIC